MSDVPGPRIYVIHNLVTKEEAEHLKSLGLLKGMEKALIIPYGGKELIESTTRTNTAAWLDFQQDPVVTKVEQAYSEITGLPAENGENLQVDESFYPPILVYEGNLSRRLHTNVSPPNIHPDAADHFLDPPFPDPAIPVHAAVPRAPRLLRSRRGSSGELRAGRQAAPRTNA